MPREVSLDELKSMATSRWPEILSSVCGVSADVLDGSHQGCPKCGGKDRFRFFDDGTGGCICNQCHQTKNGDGFSTIRWLRNCSFPDAAKAVADHFGCEYKPGNGNKRGRKKKTDPAEHLQFREWNEVLVQMWCEHKPPVAPQSVEAFGGRLASYRGQYTVIAIPILNQDVSIVGWIIYNITGGTLPKFAKGKPPEWVKVKMTYGSGSGIVGNVAQLRSLSDVSSIIKCEGVTDALAMSQITPPGFLVIANAAGATERPSTWVSRLAVGKNAYVVHDCDRPGQDGATYIDDGSGRMRPGWCPEFAGAGAVDVRNLQLGYQVTATKGKDVRDWLADGNGWKEVERLIDQSPKFELQKDVDASCVDESIDDPHHLARMNLNRYATTQDGATLRFWRDEWYAWKRTRYRKISRSELRAKVGAAVKRYLDDCWRHDKETGLKEMKPVRKVTSSLIANVIAATETMCVVPEHVELGTWLDPEMQLRERRSYLAFQNGILDLEAVMAGKTESLFPHSPKWFSITCLPYAFSPDAQCPRFFEFLRHNLEMDGERIAILQEWAGYLLLADTGQQRFLVLEGEGANGKSVYCAAIEAMLGTDNCSHVPLEVFGDRFSRTQTLGKLVNIAADVGEVDKVAEGYIKSFTSGEVMYFDRKGISGLDAYPTARMMIACNNRPRFSDRSTGIWRRMKIVPWNVQITKSMRIKNMDKPWWWEQSGELPGIFRWALIGLKRLRENGDFSDSEVCDKALADYQQESNPARSFLAEKTSWESGATTSVTDLYERYKRWCADNGHRPMASNTFGREVRRAYPGTAKERVRHMGVAEFRYVGINSESEI